MTNIVFCGVGGQGVILASKVLMETAIAAGFDVKESEVHGMPSAAEVSSAMYASGKRLHSPLIPLGGADYIVALEKLEAVRKLPYLADKGTLIVNRLQIDPVPVQNGVMCIPLIWNTGS
jgi:indolepyruvate ferredoxin oxidoreductase beta subunit